MKRALCIWLPQWPLQRIAARGELDGRTAVVLYQLNAAGGAHVSAFCPRLSGAAASGWMRETLGGIRPGMALAEATALMHAAQSPPPALHLETAEPWEDRRELEILADVCQRFAPTVGIEEFGEPDSLLLDVTGIGLLCGGEMELARKITAEFCTRRLIARIAIADTPGAAWALTHFAPLELRAPGSQATEQDREAAIFKSLAEPLVVPAGENQAALASLPPAALRLPEETCVLLGELGIWQIKQLASLRRETLLARFGPFVLLKLDQALGAAAEAILARAIPPERSFEWQLEYPTGCREMIEWVVKQLIGRVCASLARERRGVLRLACRFVSEREAAVEFLVGLYRPSAWENYLDELVRLKLETVRFPEPIRAIRFEVLALGVLQFQQRDFFKGDESKHDDPQAIATLVDRLSNRLGAQKVSRPWLLAGAQPEFACQYRPVARLQKKQPRQPAASREKNPRKSTAVRREPHTPQPGDRPLWLDPEPLALNVLSIVPDGPPLMFHVSGNEHRIARTWGPERIETGWWRSRCIRRDYYQVETREGLRYWLFRELNSGRWYLQGTFL